MSTPQKQVEEHLKSGKSLTVLECWQQYHTTELRRIVSRLNKAGLTIKGSWESDQTSNVRYKRYKAV